MQEKWSCDKLQRYMDNISSTDPRIRAENFIKMHKYIDDGKRYFEIFPRILRQSFIISLFSWFEITIEEFASLLKEKNEITDFSRDLTEEMKKFFKNEKRNINVTKDKKLWDFLVNFQSIRNFYVHLNGNFTKLRKSIDDRNQKHWRKMNKVNEYIKKDKGHYFEIIDEYLVIKEKENCAADYLTESINFIFRFLHNLLSKTEEIYKDINSLNE